MAETHAPRRSASSSRASAPALAVVVSRYNASVTDRLLAGARDVYAEFGGNPASLQVIAAPGSYELPALALAAARTGRFRGVLALGCLIKGETRHDRYIAEAVAHGLVSVTIATGLPVAFGVLTVDTPEQAEARAGGGEGNKGAEAMGALLDTVREMDALRTDRKRNAPGFGRTLPDKTKKTMTTTGRGKR
jgi:6,7-dimethyl-8-ribityllumazine synthase